MVLADRNGLWWWPKVTEAARLPGRSVEPQAANLRVRNSPDPLLLGKGEAYGAAGARAARPAITIDTACPRNREGVGVPDALS